MKYKAVGFDYGGVLVGPPGSGFGIEVSELLGIEKNRYDELYFSRYKDMNLGKVTWLDLWRDILDEIGQQDKYTKFLAIDERYHHKRESNQDVIDVAKIIKDKGYKVGILSNNSKENAERMRRELGNVFEVIHVSAETGYVKPDPEAFKQFAVALGVNLLELVFIDDAENSLKTAKECGFKDILFTGYEQLVKDLKELEIL
jgi:HAD superfamily hydrolase (TIGR01549 family)